MTFPSPDIARSFPSLKAQLLMSFGDGNGMEKSSKVRVIPWCSGNFWEMWNGFLGN
jgi:hypothetical protein